MFNRILSCTVLKGEKGGLGMDYGYRKSSAAVTESILEHEEKENFAIRLYVSGVG